MVIQGLSAVSVTAETCLVAGSVATIALLKPCEQGGDWLNSISLPYIAVDYQGRVYQNQR
ncbi:MAG: hypothetical protein HWE27_13660 [Gammaproteobacteria bacterium]|nr:hypothetical protein [Gammaproteobacteria bacterium]